MRNHGNPLIGHLLLCSIVQSRDKAKEENIKYVCIFIAYFFIVLKLEIFFGLSKTDFSSLLPGQVVLLRASVTAPTDNVPVCHRVFSSLWVHMPPADLRCHWLQHNFVSRSWLMIDNWDLLIGYSQSQNNPVSCLKTWTQGVLGSSLSEPFSVQCLFMRMRFYTMESLYLFWELP